jgi:hypothetical protein
VHVSPVFDKAPPPKASNTVLAGSWDHRAMPFTNFPDWELIAKGGANGIGGDLQSFLNTIGGALNSISALGQNFFSTIESEIASLTGLGSGSGSGAGGANDQLNQAADQGKAEDEKQKAGTKKVFQDRLDQIGGKVNHSSDKVEVTRTGGPLDLTIKEIQRLEGETKNANNNANNPSNPNSGTTTTGNNNTTPGTTDDAQKNQAQATADANKRDLDLMKEKRQRLESDIRDADAELSAAG